MVDTKKALVNDGKLKMPMKYFATAYAVGLASLLVSSCFAETTKEVKTGEETMETAKMVTISQKVQEAIQEHGLVRVIIGLKADIKPEGTLATPKEIEEQHAKIMRVQEQFLMDLENVSTSLKEHKYATIPYVAIDVNEAVLQKIVQNPSVTSIELDATAAHNFDLFEGTN